MSLTLGIDIGTSGVRCAVMDGPRLVSMARADHPDQDPDAIDARGWWQAVETCLTAQMIELVNLRVDPKLIKGVAVDGTSGSMVLTDADLVPVGPALMYNSKGFVDEAALIAQHAPDSHITQGSNSALGRAMHLVSKATATPAHLLHQADYVAARLRGRPGHSDFNNALKTGFDPEQECWPDWIGQVIDPALLPNVHAPGAALGPVAPEIADQFGLSPDLVVHAGTTDSIAAFLASAPLEEGIAVTSLGSTLAIKLLSKTRIDDPASGLYSHRLGDLWLVGGASNTGGAVLRAHFSDQQLVELTEAIDPESPLGLDYYPLRTAGERFPVNDPNLAPRLSPRPPDDALFLQAMFEGMAAIEAKCFEVIARQGGTRPKRIFTAGGGGKNPKWTAIRARALGQTPLVPTHSEAAIGVAKLAGAVA